MNSSHTSSPPEIESKAPLPRVAARRAVSGALGLALGWAVAGGQAAVLYVDPSATNPAPPYTNWASAAASIQDALDAAGALDQVLVTNGVYAAGSRGSYRVRVDKPVQVSSVNGPELTVVDGGGGAGCIYLADGSALSGFTLTNGTVGVFCQSTNAVVTNCVIAGNAGSGGTGSGAHGGALCNCTLSGNRGDAAAGAAFGVLNHCTLSSNTCFGSGGGAYQCTLNYCTLSGNRSDYQGGALIGEGGGAYQCTLNYCTLSGNCAFYAGGGASSSTLNNCVLMGNVTAGAGAGASDSTLNNCTVASNVAGQGGGGAYNSTAYNSILWFNTPQNWDFDFYTTTLNYCAAPKWPLAGCGVSNVCGLDPQFVDLAGGNLHLKPASPCINSGNNACAPGCTDMDGNPRIVGGTVDMGAYEYQGPGSCIPYHWLQQYGLPTDGSADFADPDHDGMNNWQEWRCGTNPTNAQSVLKLLAPISDGTNTIVSWQSVVGISYCLERCADLASGTFTPVAANIPGSANTTSFTDTNAPPGARFFYRVVVGQ